MSGGRTRSSAAPEWTVQESLILINEIHAIESEWAHALSSFQKWQLVAQNCAALDVRRSLSQCRRNWADLFSAFRRIKPHHQAYWALDGPQRAQRALPQSFSAEVFQAIDTYFGGREGGFHEDDDPDSDPDDLGLSDGNDVVFETGFKKQRKRAVPQKRKIDNRLNPWRHIIGKKVNFEQNHLVAASQIDVKVKSAPGSIKNCLDDSVELPNSCAVSDVKLEPSGVKVGEHSSIATSLMENVNMINSILQGNLGEEDIDSKVTTEIDFARLQGDKLIHHFGKFCNTLEQLCNNFQRSN